jgi:RNA polymerase sigma-70 factor (ECF subfamily)
MDQEKNIDYLIKQYGVIIKKIVISIVKNNHSIDDIVQETYIKLLENIDSIDKEKNLHAYICTIAINTTKDYLRRIANSKEIYCFDWNYLDNVQDKNFSFHKIIEYGLKEYVDRLPLEYRKVIKCVYFKNMSINEVAICLGVNQNTVKSRLCRGRKKLKVYIEKYNVCNC